MSNNKEILIKIKEDDKEQTLKFVFKIPTISDIIRIKNTASAMSGGLTIDDDTRLLNEKIATILTLVIEKPEWFDFDNLSAAYMPVVDKLYEEINKEIQFFRRIKVL